MLDSPTSARSAAGRWMALIAALLGWLFDGAEMGLFSMVGRSAIRDLLGFAATPTKEQEGLIGLYFGVVIALFLVGAATGGVLFGWLGDRIGRVRAMTLSVLTYAVFTGLCGTVTAPWQLGVLRFIASLGMGGEWSLGVALVMEVWPNRSRALMAGLIGAAANVGYLLVGVVGLGLTAILSELAELLLRSGLSQDLVEHLVAFQGWRLMMMAGTAPALLTFFIRIFVPESEKWEHERGKGTTSHWASADLLGVLVGAAGPALIVFVWMQDLPLLVRGAGSLVGLVIATLGYMYPVWRFLQRQAAQTAAPAGATAHTLRLMLLAAGLSGIALLGTWGSAQWAPAWANKLTDGAQSSREWTQMASAFGACVGTILAALAGDWLGRRLTYALMCALSLGSAIYFFGMQESYGPAFLVSTFILGACTASFYGWLPLYLPELFRTGVRATGQGFGFNFGRIIAAIGALQTGNLTGMITEPIHVAGLVLRPGYPGACMVMSLVYLLGFALIWLAPETKGHPLPE